MVKDLKALIKEQEQQIKSKAQGEAEKQAKGADRRQRAEANRQAKDMKFLSKIFSSVSDKQLANSIVANQPLTLSFYRDLTNFAHHEDGLAELTGYKAIQSKLATIGKDIDQVEYVARPNMARGLWDTPINQLVQKNELAIYFKDIAQPPQLALDQELQEQVIFNDDADVTFDEEQPKPQELKGPITFDDDAEFVSDEPEKSKQKLKPQIII